MKLSYYFRSPISRTAAILFGLITGLIVWIFLPLQYAALVGLAVTLLTAIIFPLLQYKKDLPYIKIKATLPQPFLIDERVRFSVKGGGTLSGFFILTQNSIVLLSLIAGGQRVELLREQIRGVTLGDDMSIYVFLNETQFIRVVCPAYRNMYEVLRENGWSADE